VGAVTGASAVLLEGCVFFLSRLPGALRPIADASAPWLATFGATCLGITALLRAGKLRLGLLLTASLVAAESVRPVLGRPGRSEARLTFLAVGHGDAAVVELPGKVILIDAGDSPRIARQIILPFLRYRGISRLDAVMITHPDRDHFGGASAIAEDIPVGFFLGPPEAPNKPETGTLWRCLKATARTHRIPWKTGAAGQRLYRGPGVSMWMIGPDSTWVAADKNDRSLVALLAAGDSGRRGPEERVLFTGDIEGPGQRALEPTWPLWRGAALKAPHHGSDRTTWPCFIEAVAAPRALISCGSRRGFPGPHTLEAFARTSTRIEITKRTGAVTWHLGSHGSRSGSDTP
jgi:competence protein ComEC